ncbi:MAG: hypothetical protein HY921_00275 [Elusimicrobia bacterium]|nr:hypothetical protein [Elusimicrobiota bacterium]
MKKTFLAFVASLGLAYYRLLGGPIDGTAWDIKIKPDSLFSFSHKDTLIFTKGQLSVPGFASSGFSPAYYNAQNMDGQFDTMWVASFNDAEKGVVSWQGMIKGDQVEGVVVWWTKGGKLKRYTFKGNRKTV